MLHLRNTPDSDCQVSPAEIIYGRQLRDSFAFLNKLDKLSNPNVFLRMYNPASTSIEAKASHCWRGNLPSSQECNVGHQRPDSSVKITEDSNGANTGKTSEVEADHEEVEEEYNPASVVPIKNKVPLALRRLKDFNAPGKLESGVLQPRIRRK